MPEHARVILLDIRLVRSTHSLGDASGYHQYHGFLARFGHLLSCGALDHVHRQDASLGSVIDFRESPYTHSIRADYPCRLSVAAATHGAKLRITTNSRPVTSHSNPLDLVRSGGRSTVARRIFMLVLSRQSDETIIIGDNIRVTIVEVRGDKVRIGIDAPRDVTVHRQEIYDAIRREAELGVRPA